MGRWLCFSKKANFLPRINGTRICFGPSFYMVGIIFCGMAYAFIVTIKAFTNPVQKLILAALWLQTSINLLLVSLVDPGYVLDEKGTDTEESMVCPICNIHIPSDAHHCQDCGLCVEGMWLGKCIGKYNMKYFSNFCLNAVVSFFYILFCRIPFVMDFINNL